MGGDFYNMESRTLRAASVGYHRKSVNEIFTQQVEKKVHEAMDSKTMGIREARDSENHPHSLPIILGLDVTGSMLHIPADLIKDGLPTLMSTLIQRGLNDAALCFIAIGDHENDRFPLQAGQFESGDAELDLWLTRTYLEGKGGGNAGESYLLAYLFAARHTVTDAWEKRGEKGFLITIGDEPPLYDLPARAIQEFTNAPQASSTTIQKLLEEAQEKWNVFHINVIHDGRGDKASKAWNALLGQHSVDITDYTQIPKVVADLVSSNISSTTHTTTHSKLKIDAPTTGDTEDTDAVFIK